MFKKFIPISFIFIFTLAAFFVVFPAPAKAATEIPGGIIFTTTSWDLLGSPYVITGNVSVSEDADLYIDPGVEVRFNSNTNLTINGTLQALGNAANPVIFTSNGSTYPGAWGRVYLNSTSEHNAINHCRLEYGQGIVIYSSDSIVTASRFFSNSYGLAILNSSPNIENNIFENNNTAISINSASPTITNNTITGGNTGLSISGTQNPVITGNTINTNDWPVKIDVHSGSVNLNTNTFTGAKKGIYVNYGNITADTTWTNTAYPYVITGVYPYNYAGSIAINSGATLTLNPGTILKFEPGGNIAVGRKHSAGITDDIGTLIAVGTEQNKIIFTSLYDDEYGGDTLSDGNATVPALKDWSGFYFSAESQNNLLDHIIMRYADQSSVFTSSFTLQNSLIEDSYIGFYIRESSPVFQNNIIRNNTFGLAVVNASPLIANNTLENTYASISLNYGNAEITSNTVSGNSIGIDIVNSPQASITDNTINTADWPVKTDVNSGSINFDTNTFAGPKKGIYVIAGDITTDLVWTTTRYPYIPTNILPHPRLASIVINNNATLTLNPGVILKFEPDASIMIGREYGAQGATHDDPGTLIASGTEQDPVVFTSLYDDEYGGDTLSDGNATAPAIPSSSSNNYIRFYSLSQNNIIDHAVIRYRNRVYAYTDSLLIKNSLFENNSVGATIISASPGFIGNVFKNNTYGLTIANGNPTIFFNEFQSNILQNIYIDPSAHPILSSPDTYRYTYDNNTHRSKFGNYWSDYIGVDANNDGIGDTAYVVANGQDDFPLVAGLNSYTEISTSTRNPVIIVPGIMGSYLGYMDFSPWLGAYFHEVWLDEISLVVSGDDAYLNDLVINNDGTLPDHSRIIVGDIIRQVWNYDFFDELIDELENNGYEENRDLFVFPYDWRLDISWTAGNAPAQYDIPTLKEKIENVLASTSADKVDIIAHSMGGLVVKKYIHDFTDQSINKFINIATPHYGAPDAFKTLVYGDSRDINRLSPDRVRHISQNMPSTFQLLPSRNYFVPGSIAYDYYIYDAFDRDNNGIKYGLNYDDSVTFMKNVGLNPYLLDNVISIHDQIDNISLDPANTYNIIGCKLFTLGKVNVLNREKAGGYEYGLAYFNGDGTAPIRSVDAINTDNKFYINGVSHSAIPSANGVRQLIAAILNDQANNFSFSDYDNLATNTDNCLISGIQIEYHCPIDLHIYDQEGRHTGLNDQGSIDREISGVAYDVIDGNSFAVLPAGANYTVKGIAKETGNFSAHIQRIENNEYKERAYFSDIDIASTATAVEIDISANQTVEDVKIKKDDDGDLVFDEILTPSSIIGENEADDLEPPMTDIIIDGEIAEENGEIYYTPITIEFAATDTLSGVLKTEYSINSTSSWMVYDENNKPAINKIGEYTIYYFSTDRAGIREEIKRKMITVVERDCVETLKKTVNDLYDRGEIKKKAVKDLLLLKINIIDKLLDEYRDYDDKVCSKKHCEKLNKKINKAVKIIIETVIKFIEKQLKLYEKQGWITSEARGIILEKIKCLNNYLE